MSEHDYPSRSLDRVMVRLPDGMRDRLKAAADENKRSVNAEVVARLETSLDVDLVALQSALERSRLLAETLRHEAERYREERDMQARENDHLHIELRKYGEEVSRYSIAAGIFDMLLTDSRFEEAITNAVGKALAGHEHPSDTPSTD